MIVRVLLVLALAGCMPFTARGGDYDGSKTLRCVPTAAMSCAGAGDCQRVTTDELDLPRYVKVDFGSKTLSGRLANGEDRTTPIEHVKKGENSTVLQGGEYGRGWSVVIQHDDGTMSGAIAGDEGAVVLLGTCIVD